MKICVATSYTPNIAEYADFCAASHRAYALANHYDVYQKSNFDFERPPAWHRIKLIPALLDKGYDYVFWADADAIFLDLTRKLEEFIDDKHDIFMVSHDFGHVTIPNTGIMIVKNSKWSREFFDKIWQEEELVNHVWWENAAVIKLLGYNHLLGGNFTPDEDVLKHVKFISHDWNCLPYKSECSTPVIHHYAGESRDVRMTGIKSDYMRVFDSDLPGDWNEVYNVADQINGV